MAASVNPTTPVRQGEELDWQTLDECLKTVLPHLRGQPSVSQFAGGNSNLTYRLEYHYDLHISLQHQSYCLLVDLVH